MGATIHLMDARLDRCESDTDRIAEGLRSVGRCYRQISHQLSATLEGVSADTERALTRARDGADRAGRLAQLVQMVLESDDLEAIVYLRDRLADAKEITCGDCGPASCPLHSLCQLANKKIV